MTDEKLKEKNTQTAIRKETQVLSQKPAPSAARGNPSFEKKRVFENVVSAGIVFGLGFLFGGAKFPLDSYPLGCALISSLSGNTIAAMMGILVRTLYLSSQGVDLLLPIICSVSLLVCRVVLNIVLFGRKDLSRLREAVSMKMLLCAVFVFGVSFL